MTAAYRLLGTDKDADGYGPGCPAGPDCDDTDPAVHPGAKELCDGKDNNCDGQVDEGVKNACGTCDPGCSQIGGGTTPFPLDPAKDPNVKDSTGIKLDANGDLVLDAAAVNFIQARPSPNRRPGCWAAVSERVCRRCEVWSRESGIAPVTSSPLAAWLK